MKLATTGFVAGAFFAALLFRALRPAPDDAVPSEAPAAAGPSAAREPGAIETELNVTEEKAAEALKAQRPNNPAPQQRTRAEARAEVAKGVFSLMDGEDWSLDFARPGDINLSYKLLALMRRLATELGVGIEELSASPEGKAALLEILFAQTQPPMDRETREAVEQAMKRLRDEWDAYAAKRRPLSRFERAVETDPFEREFNRVLYEALSGPQSSACDLLNSLWSRTQTVWVPDRYMDHAESTDAIASEWKESWSAELGLDPAQKLMLGPVVDEYVRELAALKAAHPREQNLDLLDLAIRTQKKIASMLDLTPEQARALANQARTYDYGIVRSR